MPVDVQGSFSPVCDVSDEWPRELGLNAWVKKGRTDNSLSDNSDSEVRSCCLLMDGGLVLSLADAARKRCAVLGASG